VNAFLNWLADVLGKMKRPEAGQPLPLAQVVAFEAIAQSDGTTGDGVVAKKQHVTKCRQLIRYMGEGKA
jgi:hypothetical protein